MKAGEAGRESRIGILIIEDSITQAEKLKYTLEQQGYMVYAARNGREAVERLDDHLPALIISDIIMPEMDGFTLCRTVKERENLKHIPVILLTSLSDPRDVLKGLECGADDFITKPYDTKYLLAHVHQTLVNARLRKDPEDLQNEIEFKGQKYRVTAGRQRILDLLLSTYETAVMKNNELREVQEELASMNRRLERTVEARTEALVAEIEERKKAEEELRESEERYRSLYENSIDGIILTSPDSRKILAANPAACDMLGRTEEELRASQKGDLFDLTDPKVTAFFEKRERAGKARGEVTCIHKDGTRFHCALSAALFKDRYGNIKSCMMTRDITEREHLESVAGAVNMMDNIGYIFSGVRHEMASPLQSIQTLLSFLRTQMEQIPKEKVQEYIDKALAESSRAIFLLKSLKSFNMLETPDIKETDIASLISRTVDMARNDFRNRGIKIETVMDPEARSAYIDERAFHQVLLNICTNAADALEGREKPAIVITTARRENTISVKVEDNGKGMTGKQVKEVFKPFYTTKSKGTGIGLAISKRLMDNMNGAIEITSVKDQGTVVNLVVPAEKPA